MAWKTIYFKMPLKRVKFERDIPYWRCCVIEGSANYVTIETASPESQCSSCERPEVIAITLRVKLKYKVYGYSSSQSNLPHRYGNSCDIYRVDQKNRGHRLMTMILSFLNRFKNFFSLEDSLVNLQLTDIKNPNAPCICCYTALWNINVSKTSH